MSRRSMYHHLGSFPKIAKIMEAYTKLRHSICDEAGIDVLPEITTNLPFRRSTPSRT
jgi:hypothetical protein